MRQYPSDIAFTPAVKSVQTDKGSRSSYAKMEERGGWQTKVTPELEAFLSGLDMFYLGTANGEGQPYIQYRGGSPGFLKVVDEGTLGFADFGGNRQYITLGNLSENPKAFVFLMDYVHSRRIKLWGTARVVEGDAALLGRLAGDEDPGKAERAILFSIEAWDVNCPQHIHKRFPQKAVAPLVEELQRKVKTLEGELARLKTGENELLKDSRCPASFRTSP
ncbi:MAG: pyridoxamine 5'-phosphate oxidase family protein [Pirellulaceae bacterium]